MDPRRVVSGTPVHMSHMHFTNYIESFPGMVEVPSNEDMQAQTMKKLRNEYLNGTDFEDSNENIT